MLAGNIYSDMENSKVTLKQKIVKQVPKVLQGIQFLGVMYLCVQMYEMCDLLGVSVFRENSFAP